MLVLVPAFLILFGCLPESEAVEVILDEPLERVMIRSGELIFYPAADTDWEELVSMELFEGLRPSMTFRQVKDCLGAPTEEDDDIYIAYDRPQGRITMSYESDWSWGAAFSAWRLRVYPSEPSLESIFHPAILAQLKRHQFSDRTEVVIMSSTANGPALTALLEREHVRSLTWHPYGRITTQLICPEVYKTGSTVVPGSADLE